MNDQPNKCGFVALIGAPNAGKSTLTNQLVGAKVAIVTPKVQTTRARVTGIAMQGNAQLIFVDTPGIFQPEKRLDRSMVQAAWEGANDADVIAVMVDVSRKNPMGDTQRILDGLKHVDKPVALILNKVDLVGKDRLLVVANQFHEAFNFDEIFMISALNNDGVDDFMAYAVRKIPEGVFLYPEDEISTVPMRLHAAEITREKIFLQVHQELPYSCTVETEEFNESDPAKWVIKQAIYVQRESQRAIILGHKGSRIKAIGTAARKDMVKQFGTPVHLELFVKVRDNWLEDPERYLTMGLEYKV